MLRGANFGNSSDWVDQGWKISDKPVQNPQDGSWSVYLLRTAALEVASKDELEFPFEYTTADGSLGGRSTRVTLGYKQITYTMPIPMMHKPFPMMHKPWQAFEKSR